MHLINNVECEEPRVTLKRDSTVKDATADKVVAMELLEGEIAARNVISSVPINITYESKYVWNITIIDTPGLVSHSEKGTGEVS